MSTGNDATAHLPRRNAGRIDHILLAYRDTERQERARDELTAKLGVEGWDDLGNIDETGVRIIISWSAGLELLAPCRPGSVIEQHLATRGEGFFSLVFGVADLDESVARLEREGEHPVRLDPPPDPVFNHFVVAREAVVGRVAAIPLLLGEFAPPAP